MVFPANANPAAALTDAYGRPTQGLYTPPGSAEHIPVQSTSPDHASSPSSSVTFGAPNLPHHNTNTSASNFIGMQPAVPDMANVMFPSADPFAYPEQPMTVFENHFGPMEAMNGGFDMANGSSNVPSGHQHQTIGDWMASSQAGGTGNDYKPAIGSAGPADFGLGDWIRPQQQGQQNQHIMPQHAHPHQQQQQRHGPQGPGQGEVIDYNALFTGQDAQLSGMGIPGWFNGGIV